MNKWQKFYDSNPVSATVGGHFLLYVSVIVVLFLAQCFLNDYVLRIFNNILIFIILAVSYNLINGVTGQLSLWFLIRPTSRAPTSIWTMEP